jgi:hypothetical protein
MKPNILVISVSLLATTPALAVTQLYCPQNSGYINVGMTQAQVVTACGPPLTKQKTNAPVTQKVAVKQLIYNALNTGSYYAGESSAFYGENSSAQWTLPSGTGGISLEVDIINNKVSDVRINGSSTNAMSICGGTNVQIGDNINQVLNACGSPTMTNNSYINQVVPSNSPPEVWIYQVNQYQTPNSLTFVNGKLQSIN